MRIGITYDLKDEYIKRGFDPKTLEELDSIITIESIENTLRKLGHNVARIGNIWDLTERLAKCYTYDLVFNIAEGYYGRCRESAIPALLDAYQIPYTFSDPLSIAISLDKSLTKTLVSDIVKTPKFKVITCLEDLVKLNLKYPLHVKPNNSGSSIGIDEKSYIENEYQLIGKCKSLFEFGIKEILIEEFLSGREFTTGIVGNKDNIKFIGTMEFFLNDGGKVYTLDHKEELTYKVAKPEDEMCKKCEELALKVFNKIGAQDLSRIDIRLDSDGKPNLIEINTLCGLRPGYSDIVFLAKEYGIEYEDLISMILDTSIERIFKPKSQTI